MSQDKPTSLWTLFFSFFKIGAFTFGGGYAMIPIIEKEAIEKQHWITDSDMLDIIAIAESTPGVLAVNTATFVGYKVRRFWGSLVATLGVVLPAFVVISILSYCIAQVRDNLWVAAAFEGIRAAVVVLILNAVFKLAKGCEKNWFGYTLIGVSFLLVALLNLPVIPVILGAAVLGILYVLFLLPRLRKAEANGTSKQEKEGK